MPKAVLGGATLIMFATIAVAGVKILTSDPIDRRKSLIISTSIGLGLGAMMVPEALAQLPPLARHSFFLVYRCRVLCNNYESIYIRHTQKNIRNINHFNLVVREFKHAKPYLMA